MGFETIRGRGDPEVAATEVAALLQQAGHRAVFAGGCVRDRELGLVAEDFDIATSAAATAVKQLFPRAQGVGEFFGVMLVTRHGWPIQVATFRKEGPYSDHRRPDHVEAATLHEDASRRDFTINGMYLDPCSGEMIDYFEGREDLRNKQIRAIGNPDDRFGEDHLRMLRAVRFAARLGFEIEAATLESIRRNAAAINGISSERVGDEIRRMLLDPNRAHAATLLEDLGLAATVLDSPQTSDMQPRHLASLSPGMQTADASVALAAWALDRGLPAGIGPLVDQWRSRLVLSNEDREGMLNCLEIAGPKLDGWSNLTMARQKRLIVADGFAAGLALRAVDHPEDAQAISARTATLAADGLNPIPLLTGLMLQQAGFRPGPAFTHILEDVYDGQLEGRVETLDEALALASEVLQQFEAGQ
jgi:hypothetical protein